MKGIQKGNGGEDYISYITHHKIGWNCSKIPVDSGLDFLIEYCDNSVQSGKFIFAQVKTGSSYLNEINDNHFVYRCKKEKVDYWLNSSLNVLLILFDDENEIAYWQCISESSIEYTNTGCKVLVPNTNIYDSTCVENLLPLFKKNQEFQNTFRELQDRQINIENLPDLVTFLSETKVAINNIKNHLENFSKDNKGLLAKIESLGNHPKDVEKSGIFINSYRAYTSFAKRIDSESKILIDSFYIGNDVYLFSLICLTKLFGKSIDLRNHLEGLDNLKTSAQYCIDEIRGIIDTTKNNKHIFSHNRINKDIKIAYQFYQKGITNVIKSMQNLVKNLEFVINEIDEFYVQRQNILSNIQLIEK